jgi:hypothetical protein
MDQLDDWFNVEDEEFEAKPQENEGLSGLFTEKALVVFWKFLCWCKRKGSFILPAFIFILVTWFGIEIRNVKKTWSWGEI